MFISDRFYLNNIHSIDKQIYLLSMNSDTINNYGLGYNKEVVVNRSNNYISYYTEGEEVVDDIVLELYYLDENYIPLTWTDDKLQDTMEWLITEDFIPFVSEDNLELTYFLKTTKVVKNLTFDRKGYLEVTFKPISNFAYYKIERLNSVVTTKEIDLYNYSNVIYDYAPIFEIKNLGDESAVISIKNTTTNCEEISFTGLQNGQTIIVDNLLGTVLDLNGNNMISKCNRKWFRMTKEGNKVLLSGNAEITFKAQFPVRL